MKGRSLALRLLVVTLLLSPVGCVAADRAIPAAALRSSCPRDQVSVIEKQGRTAILRVCGHRERWVYHYFNGYVFAGRDTVYPEPP